MRTKKEILQASLDDAKETLLRIEITTGYVQNKYARENDQQLLQELAKLKANEKETGEWIEYLSAEIEKEK